LQKFIGKIIEKKKKLNIEKKTLKFKIEIEIEIQTMKIFKCCLFLSFDINDLILFL